jgi:hypothetical protein
MNRFDVDERTVPAAEVAKRLDHVRLWLQDQEILDGMAVAMDELPDDVPLDELEDRLETIPDLVPRITVARWAMLCELVCPELYLDSPPSKKTSAAIPGSRSMLWRLSERARCGLALHHPRDSAGVDEPVQLELFPG